MQAALDGHDPQAGAELVPGFSPFSPPPSVSVRTIDKASGLLAPPLVMGEDGLERPPDPETVMQEFFMPGTEPTQVATPELAEHSEVVLDLYGDEPLDGDESPVDGDDPLAGELDGAEPGVPEEPSVPEAPEDADAPEPAAPAPSDASDEGYDTLPSL